MKYRFKVPHMSTNYLLTTVKKKCMQLVGDEEIVT
jgi:hypothetical protein